MSVLQNSVFYVGSVEWAAIPAWVANTPYAAGAIVTNAGNSPAVGNERVYVCIIAGTSFNGTQPTFTVSKGVIFVDGSVSWQECTGQPGVNGDITNSPQWAASTATLLGEIIYDPTSASLQIISARTGNTGSPTKPTFSATAGVTTSDNAGAVTWTSLGLASSFGAFAAPHDRILNADAASWQPNAGNTIYIASDHAETAAATTTLSGGSGTGALPNKYLSVSKTTVPPTALTAGAKITTTGAFALTVGGTAYYYGITFSSGTGATLETLLLGTASKATIFESCGFTQGTTGAFAAINISNSATAYNKLINCTFTFGATTQYLEFSGNADIINATLAGSVPTSLFGMSNNNAGQLTFRDSDISAITGNLAVISNANGSGELVLENCKLGSGVAMTTGSFGVNGNAERIKLHNCDSGTKNYRFYESDFWGTIQQETTTVDSTNPASDGTTPISWNITTSANANFAFPFTTEYLPFEIYQPNVGSSVSVIVNFAGANTLDNSMIWFEAEYLGSSLTPIGTALSTRIATILTTPTNYSASSDTWGGSPAHTQYATLTFTPAMKGFIKIRCYVARPSITVYVNPVVTISGLTISNSYLIPGQGYINENSSGGGSAGGYVFGG